MDSESEENALQTFISITDATEDVALIFLRKTGWQLDLAVTAFFDASKESDGGEIEEIPSSNEAHSSHQTPLNPDKSKPAKRFQAQSNLRTLDSIRNDSSDDNADDNGQAFYAGGSEHSGQQVLGPPRREDIVSSIFKRGNEVSTPQSSTGRQMSFSGTGYVLGNTPSSSRVVRQPSKDDKIKEITLKFWRNGFVVGDGELRSYKDDENQEFLRSIYHGEIPEELNFQSAEVHVNIEDHRSNVYVPTKRKLQTFTGAGQVLGTTSTETVPAVLPKNDTVQQETTATEEVINVDESKPVTNIQIRLADGSRLIGRFNLTHTIADIRRFISQLRPQYSSSVYTLICSFPRVELTVNEKTIEEAGLQNCALLQRLN